MGKAENLYKKEVNIKKVWLIFEAWVNIVITTHYHFLKKEEKWKLVELLCLANRLKLF